MGVRMGEDEAWRFVTDAHDGVLVSLRANGRPVALPIWFVARPPVIYVRTPQSAKKVRRVEHDERVAFLVSDGAAWAELRGVHVEGDATIVTDPDLVREVGEMLDQKYAGFRTAPAQRPDATNRHYADRTVIAVKASKLLSWDNRRLG